MAEQQLSVYRIRRVYESPVPGPSPFHAEEPSEELASSLTHGLGLVLSLAGVVGLLTAAAARGDASHLLSCSIFGGTLVFMYAASTLYHSFRAPRLKHLFRIVDHISIYLLIAGTYTPFLLVYFTGPMQWTLLTTIWTLALLGTVFKIFYTGRFKRLSTALYVGMGWLIVAAAEPFLEVTALGCILWLLAGGLFYTCGVLFFLWERLPYNHAIWHLFVLGGSFCHYTAVVLYVLPP